MQWEAGDDEPIARGGTAVGGGPHGSKNTVPYSVRRDENSCLESPPAAFVVGIRGGLEWREASLARDWH